MHLYFQGNSLRIGKVDHGAAKFKPLSKLGDFFGARRNQLAGVFLTPLDDSFKDSSKSGDSSIFFSIQYSLEHNRPECNSST